MRYPVVLFDIGETLVGPRSSYGAVYGEVLHALGITVERVELDRSIAAVSAEWSRRIPAGTDRFSHFPGGETEFWSRFLAGVLERAIGRAPDPGVVREALTLLGQRFGRRDAWRVYEDVFPALDALRQLGVRMGVVSNWDSRLSRVLERLDLAGYFETVGVSHLERIEKPDPLLFRRVLGRMGAGTGETLHVGNVPELDRDGAHAAGLDCLLIDRAGKLDEKLEAVPDLKSLPRIVREGLASPTT